MFPLLVGVFFVLSHSALGSLQPANGTCDVAVVGAGVGGAYAAWRASDAGKSVCVFEMNDRPGGRIHSLRGMGPKEDLVVEAGAYRFTASMICSKEISDHCIDTPITRAVVKELNIPMAEYDPDPTQWDYEMRKLVDANGNDAGYLTLPETLLAKAVAKGAQVHYNSKVTSMTSFDNGGVTLTIQDSAVHVFAKAVVLNIPQGPLLKLIRHSKGAFRTSFPEPLYRPTTWDMVKLYVHYDDAWWRNDLGLKTGHFVNNVAETASSSVTASGVQETKVVAPLMGQYHDGDLRCDLPQGRCRGYLQAYYSPHGYQFFKPFHPVLGEAAVHLSHEEAEQSYLLTQIHASLVELHREALDAINATERVTKMRPSSGLLSIWSEGVDGINTGCHLHDQSDKDFMKAVLQPFEGLPVYIANEAYGTNTCWAEGSLNMSHRVMQALDIPVPSMPWTQLPRPSPPLDPFFLVSHSKPSLAKPVII